MEVLVIGAGSLGSLVGGLLAREHAVTLVGSPDHVEAIRASGLTIEGLIEERAAPAATTDPAGASAELAIVTAKAYDTDRAAATLADCDVDAVWSLQNGLDNEARLAAALDATVLAGTATYGADLTAPGTVVCTGLGELAIGPRPDTPTPDADLERAREIGTALAAGESADAEASADADAVADADAAADADRHPHVVVDEAMPERLWRKLAVNVGINPATALARVENGALAASGAGTIGGSGSAVTARRAARETARVAQASGVDLPADAAVAELDAVVAATAANRSSMLQDVEGGSRTEIDAIAGAVIDRADEAGVAVPTVRTLASLIRAWERGEGLR